ncbi:MAG: PrsW family intramembrane metalloprotease [Flavobacteriales bacterium]|nr:PrsW family intramembrane metalloprotease [Flavobacteriales bacterium]
MIFQAALLIVLLVQLSEDLRITRRLAGDRAAFLRTPLVRSLLVCVGAIVLGRTLLDTGVGAGVLGRGKAMLFVLSTVASFGISFLWYRYLTWLDMFERERRRYILLTFFLACASTLLVFPASDLIHRHTPLVLDGTAWNDWWYSTLAIGLVEETAKLLPYLVMLRATRQVNEPFDHLLYGSVSALGFAFMENVLYLEGSGMHSFTGRAFTSSVSHMFDTSIICYGVALAVRQGRPVWPRLLGLLGLAALAHGFYDFWLLSPGRPAILTFFFYLGTLHLWVVMKTNLVNISPHYFAGALAANRTIRYRILSGFVVLYALVAVLVQLRAGNAEAWRFAKGNAFDMAGTLVLLTMTFSSFTFIRGHVAPLRVPLDLRKWFLPRYEEGADLSGQRITLRLTERGAPTDQETFLAPHLPLEGVLVERIAFGEEKDWFMFVPDRAIPLGAKYVPDRFLVNLHKDHDMLSFDRYALMRMRALKAPLDLSVARVSADGASKSFFRVYARRLVPHRGATA